jgi:uncharacterized membrane protein
MGNEPARVVSIVMAVVLLALPHLSTFGVPITPEQEQAIENFLPAVLALIGGQMIRSRVTPV